MGTSGGKQGQVTSDPASDASLVSGMPGVLPQIGRVKLNLDMSNARASALSLSIRGIVTVRLESGHPHSYSNSNRVSEPSTQGLLSARSWVNKGQGAMPMGLLSARSWV